MNNKYSNETLALKAGDLIVYPTEAVWGIGCDPKNNDAIYKLLEAKNRPLEKGVILIASHYQQLSPYLSEEKVPTDRMEQILSSWPGPVTWLLPVSKLVSNLLTGGSDLIAVRVTDHPTVKRICDEFGGAIISTSANKTGQATPIKLEEIQEIFEEQVKCYVDEPLGGNLKPSKIINGLTGQIIRS